MSLPFEKEFRETLDAALSLAHNTRRVLLLQQEYFRTQNEATLSKCVRLEAELLQACNQILEDNEHTNTDTNNN